MPPEFKSEAILELADGRKFTLTMNNAILFDAEQASGIPLPRLMAQAKMGFLGATRAFLFASLRPLHPDVSMEQASQMTLREYDTVDAALTVAMKRAFPDIEVEEGKQDSHPPKPRRGKNSGRNGAKSASSRKRSGEQPHAPIN